MIWYMHTNGQADSRIPVRTVVGPYQYKTADGVFLINGDIPKVSYSYQQLQIGVN